MKRLLIVLLALACGLAAAQDSPPVRLRATVESFADPMLVIRERSGQVISLTVPEETGIVEVIRTDITAVQPGSFIGTAALPRPDGKLEALEVVVFPEAARGTGEGHFPWDLKPDSSMTNATVTDLSRSTNGRTLSLRYKDAEKKNGEKMVVVPDGVPVVTFRPGDRALIVPGAKVFIVAEVSDGQYTVRRLLIGRNGLVPPM
jgi:hypothetical protein